MYVGFGERLDCRRAASGSGGECGGAVNIEEGHLRRWPLHGKSGRRVKKAGFRKPALQRPILPSGAIGGKYAW